MHHSKNNHKNSSFNSNDRSFMQHGMRPLYQNSPRFHQQYVPHYSNGGTPGPGNGRSPRPHSPYTSPPHYNSFDSPNPYWNQGNGSSFSSTPDMGRGRHRHNAGSPRFILKNNLKSPRDSDSNPGGSNDIRQYYNPEMLRDPWANLKPVPAKVTSNG